MYAATVCSLNLRKYVDYYVAVCGLVSMRAFTKYCDRRLSTSLQNKEHWMPQHLIITFRQYNMALNDPRVLQQ